MKIVEARELRTRTGMILKDESIVLLDDIVRIDVNRSVRSTVLGFGAADLTIRDSSGSGNLTWENCTSRTRRP